MQLANISYDYSLTIGVITDSNHKIKNFINSFITVSKYTFIKKLSIFILNNGSQNIDLQNEINKYTNVNFFIIDEKQQQVDTEKGLFGELYNKKPKGKVGIAHARSMLQKYVGLFCDKSHNNFAWILDDDMLMSSKTEEFLGNLPRIKNLGIDVIIGSFEMISPNPPLHGLRVQVFDLIANLEWLNSLEKNEILPDREFENNINRYKFPDYYYDLSRKHTEHLKTPFWITPIIKDETVENAMRRILKNVNLLFSGYSLFRPLKTPNIDFSVVNLKDSVNRGGNTFILNPKALIITPNIIFKSADREVRRSDMVWAIINKQNRKFSIKKANFPVIHISNIKKIKSIDFLKMKNELLGSSLYSALQEFLNQNPLHNLVFKDYEIEKICMIIDENYAKRVKNLKNNLIEVQNLNQTLLQYEELDEFCSFIAKNLSTHKLSIIDNKINEVTKLKISSFLKELIKHSNSYAIETI